MLTEVRWQREQELMQSVFPGFKPFARGAHFGFEGYLRGARSGRCYQLVLEADHQAYPQSPPSVRMNPRIGIHWIGDRDRRLCMEREWRPARSTFANTMLAVIRYLDEHDPEPGSAEPSYRGDGEDRAPDRESDTGPDVPGCISTALYWRIRRPW